MFQAKYYKKDKYHAQILLLGEEQVGEIESDTLEDVIDKYIKFEEEYYGFKFTDEMKKLRHISAELIFKLGNEYDDQLLKKAIEVNVELQNLYVESGFERIRSTYRANFIAAEEEELKSGGELNG